MTEPNRWSVLAVSVLAQTGTSFYQFGVPYLLPQVQGAFDVSLFMGSMLVAAPTAGMVLTLLPWGYAADRIGDRPVMVAGLLGATASLLFVALADSVVGLGLLLMLAGGFGASVNVTSGRVVLRSFDASRRGLAMGVRQVAPLLGMALAALTLPSLGVHHGYAVALLVPALVCLVAAWRAFAVLEAAPARQPAPLQRSRSPYAGPRLWRLHGASALLVVPQIAVASFAFLYLVTVPGWTPLAAGAALAVGMTGGGVLRLLAGAWSDQVGDRTGPMRILALVAVGVLGIAAALMGADVPGASVTLIAAAALTASWNGLAFTAVAETAGPAWAGRALGVQNSVQYVTTAATPPAMALVIGPGRYPGAFLAAGLVGLIAVFLVPVGTRTSPAVSGAGGHGA
ncbi:MFS transporter [Nocardioides sp.]|uniref:MFS transporter n=1 Tax=Nocardioides sp. TaxID=35761 RepID=UPI003D106686